LNHISIYLRNSDRLKAERVNILTGIRGPFDLGRVKRFGKDYTKEKIPREISARALRENRTCYAFTGLDARGG